MKVPYRDIFKALAESEQQDRQIQSVGRGQTWIRFYTQGLLWLDALGPSSQSRRNRGVRAGTFAPDFGNSRSFFQKVLYFYVSPPDFRTFYRESLGVKVYKMTIRYIELYCIYKKGKSSGYTCSLSHSQIRRPLLKGWNDDLSPTERRHIFPFKPHLWDLYGYRVIVYFWAYKKYVRVVHVHILSHVITLQC